MDSRDCRQPPGLLRPVVDRNRCEGKGDCVDVCPYGVFSVGTLPLERRRELSLFGKLRGHAHGWQQAFTPNADACRACGQLREGVPGAGDHAGAPCRRAGTGGWAQWTARCTDCC